MKNLRIHCIQHVAFEKPAVIEDWAIENEHQITFTHIYKKEVLPEIENIDFLLIMGGPMSVYEEEKYPWITKELNYIKDCIQTGKAVLGICLGAQFIARALDAKVYRGPAKEIGWFPVQFMDTMDGILPDAQTVFHWHGDTFDIPEGALHLASSSVVPNQGFIYNETTIALQFHLEVKEESVKIMLDKCRNDLTDDPYVQSSENISNQRAYYSENNKIMRNLLFRLSDTIR